MNIIFLIETDVVNFWRTSMCIGMPYCDGKCWKDLNVQGGNYDWSLCHNGGLLKERKIEIPVNELAKKYMNNPLSHAVVFAGMEPLMSMNEVVAFIAYLRGACRCDDPVIIYTGYNENEEPYIKFHNLLETAAVNNVIVKFGRYVPDQKSHLDPVLKVMLASDNQYAKQIC